MIGLVRKIPITSLRVYLLMDYGYSEGDVRAFGYLDEGWVKLDGVGHYFGHLDDFDYYFIFFYHFDGQLVIEFVYFVDVVNECFDWVEDDGLVSCELVPSDFVDEPDANSDSYHSIV